VRIAAATESDVPVILELIHSLALYERLAHEVVATAESLRASLFGARAAAEVAIAYLGEEPVVSPCGFRATRRSWAGPGCTSKISSSSRTGAVRGSDTNSSRTRPALPSREGRPDEWSVLDWNEPAIGFYRAIGAVPMN